MHVAYVVITTIAALANAYAAILNFAGAESVKVVADRVQVPRLWMVPLGSLLAVGAVGLVVGFGVPVLGYAASTGLIVYFAGAICAHVRVGDRGIGGAVFFLALAVLTLVGDLVYRSQG